MRLGDLAVVELEQAAEPNPACDLSCSSRSRGPTMVFDNQCQMVDDPDREARTVLLG